MIPFHELGRDDAPSKIVALLPEGSESAPVYSGPDYIYFGRDNGKVYAVIGMQDGVGRSYTERTEQTEADHGWPHWVVGILSAFGPYSEGG
jgi:hypothetical protein